LPKIDIIMFNIIFEELILPKFAIYHILLNNIQLLKIKITIKTMSQNKQSKNNLKTENNHSSLNQSEVEKFSTHANEWWDPRGNFKTLHQINPVRLNFIREQLINRFSAQDDFDANYPLKGLKLLDIGCGGGLVSLPLAKLGAEVTGIDASSENIEVARSEAKKKQLDVELYAETLEAHKQRNLQYDGIICLELIEHVENPAEFVKVLSQHIRPGGLAIFSTINRNLKSLLKAKLAAEYLLGWLERGTHEFRKFIKPEELSNFLGVNDLELLQLKGLEYSIINGRWSITNDPSVNYFLTATKVRK
jgi:2-polyprenyl-6-hydroxyphenyl methylase/3-demethylubiquinone-9 3-methyltransferase